MGCSVVAQALTAGPAGVTLQTKRGVLRVDDPGHAPGTRTLWS